MINQDFFAIFKDYLPLLSGLITLTSAGFFGYILQHMRNIQDATPDKQIIATIELKSKLKSAEKLEALDEIRLNKSINKLKDKAIDRTEYIANGNKYIGDKVIHDLGYFIFMGIWVLILELLLYSSIIAAILFGNYWFLFGIIAMIIAQFLWETRKVKLHLQ